MSLEGGQGKQEKDMGDLELVRQAFVEHEGAFAVPSLLLRLLGSTS